MRWLVEYMSRNEETAKAVSRQGRFFLPQLIAGESLVGVIIAILIFVKVPVPKQVVLNENWFSLMIFIVLAIMLGWVSYQGKKNKSSAAERSE